VHERDRRQTERQTDRAMENCVDIGGIDCARAIITNNNRPN